MLDAWASLHLLRHPGSTSQTNSMRQRTRRILDEIAALSLVRSTQTFWRGHAKAGYRLTPSAVHTDPPKLTSSKAVADYVEFQTSAVRGAQHVWRNGISLRTLVPVEQLALLQHFGVPTPLLDLTADPLVALYFAVRRHDDHDGLLIGWNAVGWIDYTNDSRSYAGMIGELRHEATLGWFVPPVVTDRVVVQRSRMLIAPVLPSTQRSWFSPISDLELPKLPAEWGDPQLGALFEPQGQGRRAMPPVLGFRINRGLKSYIRSVLSDSFGLSHETLFPDPAGYATERPT